MVSTTPSGPAYVWGRAVRTVLPSSLGRRIVTSVAIGLALVLILFSVVSLWTIQEATDSAYAERVALAQALVWHVDDILGYSLTTLETEASSISDHQPGQLDRSLFASLALTDANGDAVWADPPRPGVAVGQPWPDPGVAAALSSGAPQVTQMPLPNRERAFANLAVPVRDEGGQITGVLSAEVDPGLPGLNLLPVRPVGDSIQVHLMNSDGWILAGSAEDGLDTQMDRAHAVLLADLIQNRSAGYRIHSPPPVQTTSGEWVTIPSHIVAYAPISLLPTWGVVVEQPKDVVLASSRELEVRLALAGVALVLLAAAGAWLDVHRVVRPLERLTRAARRFAAGDLDEPIMFDRSDELGVLAHAFETMRQRLRASLAEVSEWNRELERRVAARTSERAELLQRIIAGQEEERRRLAQELHDQTSQALASLQLGLDRLAAGVDNADEARRVATVLRGVAENTLEAVHHLAVELRPSVLDDVGLVAALQRYLREWAARTDIDFDFVPVGVEGLRLVPAAETAVYRILQAALTNIAQHANAHHISVILQRRGDKLVAVVEDDGQGFDPAFVRSRPLEGRLGLAGMEERATLIGATLTLESTPGAGSTVFLEVPLDTNALREDVGASLARSAS